MRLVLIPKGTYQTGSSTDKQEADNAEDRHQVTIGKDFYLGVTEVTQGQYEKVMGTNPSHFQKQIISDSDSSTHPVETISWEDAVEFCRKLSDLPEEKKAGRLYRLPTEAEWGYACRAGSQEDISFGENAKALGEYAWFRGNSNGHTQPVGQKKPNAWGLYDMHGNVWEWCSDLYGDYPESEDGDATGQREELLYVHLGGGWTNAATFFRTPNRRMASSTTSDHRLGFRVAFSASAHLSEQ